MKHSVITLNDVHCTQCLIHINVKFCHIEQTNFVHPKKIKNQKSKREILGGGVN